MIKHDFRVVPPPGLAGSRVLRALYARRGAAEGQTVLQLARDTLWAASTVNTNLSYLQRSLDRAGTGWRLLDKIDDDGLRRWRLEHPLCPPRQPGQPTKDYEPEIISLEELAEEEEG